MIRTYHRQESISIYEDEVEVLLLEFINREHIELSSIKNLELTYKQMDWFVSRYLEAREAHRERDEKEEWVRICAKDDAEKARELRKLKSKE